MNWATLCLPIIAALAPQVCVAQRGERLLSPEVHADRTVTFRLRAPNADQVIVHTQFTEGDQSMTKDDVRNMECHPGTGRAGDLRLWI